MNWRKAPKGAGVPRCGRKFCSCCGRWRHLLDFDCSKRTERGTPLVWQAKCKTCCKVQKRIAGGHTQRRYGHGDVGLERKRRNAEQARRMLDTSRRDQRREYDRIYKESQRRAAGIPERKWGPRSKRHGSEKEQVSVEPLKLAFLASPITASEVAVRLGWTNAGQADTTRVMRSLGLAEYDRGKGYGMGTRTEIGYELAKQLVVALGLDGVDLGL